MTSPSTAQWANRTEIKSESSSRVYVVSEKVDGGVPTGTWGCSCPGWKSLRASASTCGPSACRAAASPPPRARAGLGRGGSSSFGDGAYDHYDTRTGFGSPEDWIRAAAGHARGRSQYQAPPRTAPGVTPDMALLGLTVMPADVKDLVRAMRIKARKLHPNVVHPTDMNHVPAGCAECDSANRAFTAVMQAYERLLTRYPK